MSFLSEDIDEMNRVFIIHGSFGVLCSVLYIFEKMAYRMSRGEYFNATYVRVTRVYRSTYIIILWQNGENKYGEMVQRIHISSHGEMVPR